jgi:ribosomal-protein-alanine N-acetyltransferase
MFKKLIETPRLILKEKSLEDFQRFFTMSKDPEVMKYIGDGSIFHWTKDVALEKFSLSLSAEHTEPYFDVAVYRIDINLYIGWCRVSYSKFLNRTALEYRLCSDSWGNGYATETVSAVLNELFKTDMDKIFACTHPDNTASMKVLQKIRFQFLNTKFSRASGKELQIFGVDRKSFSEICKRSCSSTG